MGEGLKHNKAANEKFALQKKNIFLTFYISYVQVGYLLSETVLSLYTRQNNCEVLKLIYEWEQSYGGYNIWQNKWAV